MACLTCSSLFAEFLNLDCLFLLVRKEKKVLTFYLNCDQRAKSALENFSKYTKLLSFDINFRQQVC